MSTSHSIRLLEFLATRPGVDVAWNATDLGEYVILSEQPSDPTPFLEVDDHALDAVEYYCVKKVFGISQICFLLFR